MDVCTDGQTDGRTYGNSPLCPTGHRPFGAAAQKPSLKVQIQASRLKSELQGLDPCLEVQIQVSKLKLLP